MTSIVCYGAAKIAHEQTALSGPIPARVLRAAQFDEFVAQLRRVGQGGRHEPRAADAHPARGRPYRRRGARRSGHRAASTSKAGAAARSPRSEGHACYAGYLGRRLKVGHRYAATITIGTTGYHRTLTLKRPARGADLDC
jgi:hypothetical protein